MTRTKNVYLALVAALLSPLAAHAVPIVDQESLDVSVTNYLPTGWQQGVTVGITGQLTGIEIYSSGVGDAVLSVFAGAPWQSGPALAEVAAALIQGWNLIDLSGAGLFFDAGDQFTWSSNGNNGALTGSSLFAGSYDGGIAIYNNAFYFDGEYDLAFRTYMDVVEPGTLALLGLGLAGMGFARRRGKV